MEELYKRIGKKIRKLREQVGISQQQLARQLGVSRPKVSQIENGEAKISADELVKLSETLNVPMEQLLEITKEPKIILPMLRRKKENAPGIRINVPQKNLEKFKQILLYILGRVGSRPNIGETVLYKILYFIDFDFYEKYEEQLIGATYIKNKYGPTPLEFRKIVKQMEKNNELRKIKDAYFQYPQTKYLPLKEPDLSKLKAVEIELINSVLARLSGMNAAQISEYSHNDVPWLTTPEGGIIEYESVFYRTPPYSVREYGESI
ncbi:MAG: helix-turn-helix domain-containing protein [Candidatus Sumerlaeia bacterium]|nr:helix-turn-helix domain-containing protein [Candidatus Sumerlaeia bacterium]